jgi:gentisate 1,2-dioxygenase
MDGSVSNGRIDRSLLMSATSILEQETEVQLAEIFADEQGETHFRKVEMRLEMREFAPPSMPVQVTTEIPTTAALFMIAPPGWDKNFHATPRKQICVMLSGKLTVTATDGETIEMGPGDVLLVNDAASRGHLSQIQGVESASFLFVGLDVDHPFGT